MPGNLWTVAVILLGLSPTVGAKQAPPYVTPQGLALSPDGKWMLHVEETGIRLLRVEDRRSPVCVDGASLPGHGSDGVFLSVGNRLYAAAVDGLGLSVFSIQDGKLELVSRLAISKDNIHGPESIHLVGTTCYLACRLSGLGIVDLSAPVAPKLISMTRSTNFARKPWAAGNHVFLADSRGLTVMDVEDATKPRIVGFLKTPDIATDVTIHGDLAVVGCGKNWLLSVNVSVPERPKEIGRFRGRIVWYGSYFFDCVVVDKTLHVGFAEGGYLRIDISNPSQPKWVSEYHVRRKSDPDRTVFDNMFTRAIVIDDDLAYLGDKGYIEVVDISHPANVIHVSRIKTEFPSNKSISK